MAGGFANFLIGMGGGYIKARDKEYDRARQEKLDKQADELHAARMEEINNARAERQAVQDAMAPRTTMQGTAVTDGAGNANLYQDPAQAQAAADEARIEAEMRGQNPGAVMTSEATGVTGNMSKGHQITSGPVDLDKLNSRDARLERATNALMERGNVERGLSMENAVMDSKAKKIGLESAQLKFADEKFNRTVMERIQSSPTFWDGFAKVLTDTQLGGLAGVTVAPVLSADGKTVQMVGTKDGTQQVLATFDASERGQQEALQRMMRADPATKIMYLKETADRLYKEGRDKTQDEKDDRRLTAEETRAEAAAKNAETTARKLDLMLMGGAGGRGGGGQDGASGPAFDPYEGFDPKNAQAEATRIVAEQIMAGGKPVSAEERARLISNQVFALRDAYAAQNANRQRASVFQMEARQAQTPEQIEAVRQQALARGLTQQQMEALDPRFKINTSAAPAPAAAATPSAGGPARPPAPAPYAPPPNSPAARAQANRQTATTRGMEREAQAKTEAQTAAQSALQTRDPATASQVQRLPGFRYLSQEEKAAIFNLANGR